MILLSNLQYTCAVHTIYKYNYYNTFFLILKKNYQFTSNIKSDNLINYSFKHCFFFLNSILYGVDIVALFITGNFFLQINDQNYTNKVMIKGIT